MNWLPWPVLPKKRWPAIKFKEKRAITQTEHQAIVQREQNPERKAFYQLAWHLGASQSDTHGRPKLNYHRWAITNGNGRSSPCCRNQ
jgi:hypothetical protein